MKPQLSVCFILLAFSLSDGTDPALQVGTGDQNTGQCTGCAIGHFMQQDIEGGLTCAPCPPGSYSADNSSVTCDRCQIGTFQQDYGRGYCEPCASGFFGTKDASDRCTPCSTGQFQDRRKQTECKLCDMGTFTSIYGSVNCTACPLGSFSTRGSRACRRCPAGSFGSLDANNRGICEPCPYNNVTGKMQGSDVVGAKSEAEADCRPLDAIVVRCDTIAQERCGSDEYLSRCGEMFEGECLECSGVCPSRTVSHHCGGRNPGCCALPWKETCIAPADGFMDITISAVMDFTFEEFLVLNELCGTGMYDFANGTNYTCASCPMNTFSNKTGATAISDCTPCPIGTTSRKTGAIECFARPSFLCDSMQVQPDPWSPCVWCLPYQIPSENSSTCENLNRSLLYSQPLGRCTENQVTSTRYNESASAYYVICVNCPPVNETEPTVLQYAGLDALVAPAQCSTGCRPGTYTLYATVGETSGDNYTCPSCPPGSFSTKFGGLECSQCEPGTYSDVPASMHCDLSPAGTVQPFYGASSYTACAAGSISAAGATVCTLCPAGSRNFGSMGRTTCQLCPTNSYNNINGSQTCTMCPPGSSTLEPGATYCDPCPAGNFLYTCPGCSSNDIVCTPCPRGTFGATHSAIECTRCPDLKIGREQGLTECTDECPDGRHPMFNKQGCKDCPIGTYGTAGVCTDCKAGTYQDIQGAAFTCKECDHGNENLYQPDTGQTQCNSCINGNATNSTSCVPCGPGTHFNFHALPCRCTACMPGYVQALHGQMECVSCDTQTTGLVAFRTGMTQCHRCPRGEQPYNSSYCTSCPLGSFENGIDNTCVLCEENTFADTPGGVFSSSCKPCPTGTSTLGVKGAKSDTTDCLPCPEGKYLRDGKCHNCIPGSFSDTPGAVDVCTPCAQGHYSSKTSVGSSDTGILTCSKCMPGTVTDQIGTVNCTLCPAGYADDGLEMTTCIQCEQGLMAVNFECPEPIPTTTSITTHSQTSTTPLPTTTTSQEPTPTPTTPSIISQTPPPVEAPRISVQIIFPIPEEVFLTVADSMKQIIATIAGVEASAVTIISINVYGSARRLLQESSIIVIFLIRLSQDETFSQVTIIERSLTTRNIVDGIQSSSDETIKSILPNGVVVFTVVPIDRGEVLEGIDVEDSDDGISIVLVLIVVSVSVLIVLGISVLVCLKCRKSVKKPQTQISATRAQFNIAHHVQNVNVHRDEDMFKFIPFYSTQDHLTTPSIQRHTPRILDYSMS